jgi:hypothetical protein
MPRHCRQGLAQNGEPLFVSTSVDGEGGAPAQRIEQHLSESQARRTLTLSADLEIFRRQLASIIDDFEPHGLALRSKNRGQRVQQQKCARRHPRHRRSAE